MSAEYRTILLDVRNEILTITLNRPDKRNALNDLMVKELIEVLQKYQAEPEISVLLLKGNGSAFCAGADLLYLKELLGKDLKDHRDDSRQLRNMFYLLYSFPRPTIALVNGPAIGGGCGLVNVCDLAVAAEGAKFGYPEVKIGFVPALVSVFLVASVGARKAKELLLSGRIITAREAAGIGLINDIVKNAKDLDAKAHELAEIFKRNAPSSLIFTKNFCNKITLASIEKILDDGANLNAESRLHENFREGILSFIEKRTPEWIR